MTNPRPDLPLDPITLQILRLVDKGARERKISYFVIGATTRDILLRRVPGIEGIRATRDLNFAVGVGSWVEFDQFEDWISRNSTTIKGPGPGHRIYFQPQDDHSPVPISEEG